MHTHRGTQLASIREQMLQDIEMPRELLSQAGALYVRDVLRKATFCEVQIRSADNGENRTTLIASRNGIICTIDILVMEDSTEVSWISKEGKREIHGKRPFVPCREFLTEICAIFGVSEERLNSLVGPR